MKLSTRKAHDRNPRTITDEKLAMLEKAVLEFGDMGGIVFNRKTGKLVGGHQRSKVLKDGNIVITRKQKRDSQGTVASGHVEIGGHRYGYREVEWDVKTEAAAMIAANQHGGEWSDGLVDLLKELDGEALDLTGFDSDEIEKLLTEKAEPVSLQKLDTRPAPDLAWVLIAVPFQKFSAINPLIDAARKIKGSICKTTTSDNVPNGQKLLEQ